MKTAEEIRNGAVSLGVELGSTRIKSVLIGADHQPIAVGSYEWENQQAGGFWTYSLEDIWNGLRGSIGDLQASVEAGFGMMVKRAQGIGFSAMMHG
ncbi:MAG: ATPase, partial [Puniceicoccales bacterium]